MSRSIERILQILRREPGLSKEEIAERACIGVNTLSGGGYLKTMRSQGLIFISGWRRNGSGGFTTPIYSVGAGPDYPKPAVGDENRDAPAMARLLAAIEKYGPIDYRQAAKLSGVAVSTAKNAGYLHALLVQGKIYICSWRRARNGPMRPVYMSGTSPCAEPLQPYTPAEKSRAYRWRREAANAASFAGQVRRLRSRPA